MVLYILEWYIWKTKLTSCYCKSSYTNEPPIIYILSYDVYDILVT